MIDLSHVMRREALLRLALLETLPGDSSRHRHYLVMR